MNNNHGRRRTRRVRQQRKQQKTQIGRILLTVGLMALIAVVSIGGTIAWLTDSTSEIKNTFTPSGIGVTLTESKLNEDGTYEDPAENVENAYKIIPGKTYKKDPKVAIESDTDVPVYLFVKFEESQNAKTYFDYTSTLTTDNGWTAGTGEDGNGIPTDVWYRTVNPTDETKEWQLLTGNTTFAEGYITVLDTVKEEDMANADDISLIYKAYAIQTEGFDDEADAWEEVVKLDNTGSDDPVDTEG